MKKVLALVICIAMIACFAVTASAADYTVTYTVSSYEGAKVGDTVTVTVSLTKNSDLGALEFDVDLDDEYLEATSITNSRGKQQWYAGIDPVAKGASVMGSDGLNAESGTYKFAFANAEGIYEEGALVEFYVKVIKELPEEGAAIDLIVNATTNYEDSGKTYENVIVNGVVKGVKAEEPPVPSEDPSKPEPVDPSKPEPVDPSKPEDPSKPADPSEPVQPGEPAETDTDAPAETDTDVTGTDTEEGATTDIPKTGETTAIAVAAGLCAVMAAAFVITKKVND